MKRNIASLIVITALTLIVIAFQPTIVASQANEKPIIVCTTHVLGSIAEDFVGDQVDVIMFVQPGMCPAFYDVKPSDIYAISKAELVFYHGFEWKMWLESMVEASGNPDVTKVKISGNWNTPDGAKLYVNWIGGNLSEHLSTYVGDLTPQIDAMTTAIDAVAQELTNEAESLNVGTVKVVCMAWQRPFVEWLGFNVTAEYGPPEMLSAGFIANLTDNAIKEEVMLVVDNLQSGVDFGAGLASDIGAVQAILTNFPGAVPKTGNLTQMFSYNAEQLFNGVTTWESTQSLRAETGGLKNQLAIFQVTTCVVVVVAIVEGVLLYFRKKR